MNKNIIFAKINTKHKTQDTNMKRIVTLTKTEHELIETVRNYRRSFVSS